MHNRSQLSKDLASSKKLKAKPDAFKKDVDYKSMMGFRDDSPFKDNAVIDINTPTGMIDMSQTGTDLIANGRYLPAYSGMHQFDPGIVTETKAKNGGWLDSYQEGGQPPVIDRLGRTHSGNSGYIPQAQTGMQYNFPPSFTPTGEDSSRWRTYVNRYMQGKPSTLDRAHELDVSIVPDWLDKNTKNQLLMEHNAYKEGERLKKLMNTEKKAEGGAFSNKVSKLVHEGYPQKQAVAIAYSYKKRGKLASGGWLDDYNS